METEDIPEYDVRSERAGRVRILFRDALGRARSSRDCELPAGGGLRLGFRDKDRVDSPLVRYSLLQRGKTLFLETWVSLEDTPVLSTVLPAVQDVCETVALKATGKTLGQLDNSHISPLLAHIDVEYLDGAARKTVDLWSVVIQKLAADMLMKHVHDFKAEMFSKED